MSDWFPSDREALVDLIAEALAAVPVDDSPGRYGAAEVVVRALEVYQVIPALNDGAESDEQNH